MMHQTKWLLNLLTLAPLFLHTPKIQAAAYLKTHFIRCHGIDEDSNRIVRNAQDEECLSQHLHHDRESSRNCCKPSISRDFQNRNIFLLCRIESPDSFIPSFPKGIQPNDFLPRQRSLHFLNWPRRVANS